MGHCDLRAIYVFVVDIATDVVAVSLSERFRGALDGWRDATYMVKIKRRQRRHEALAAALPDYDLASYAVKVAYLDLADTSDPMQFVARRMARAWIEADPEAQQVIDRWQTKQAGAQASLQQTKTS